MPPSRPRRSDRAPRPLSEEEPQRRTHQPHQGGGLAVSLVDSADDDADVDRIVRELAQATGDPRAQVAAFVGYDRRLFEHGGDALRVIVEGMRNEPALAAAYDEASGRGERARQEVFSTWPASARRKGVPLQRALDAYAITVSLQAYDIAVHERGWSPSASNAGGSTPSPPRFWPDRAYPTGWRQPGAARVTMTP